MNYDNFINNDCFFIEYETNYSKGRIVLLAEYYNKVSKKLWRSLKKCTLTMFIQRKFTYQDIDFVKKGSVENGH